MLDFLRKVDLFSDLDQSDLEQISAGAEERHLADGELLFSEGGAGNRAYVIKEGQLEILKASAGREVQLAVRSSGEVIGEMALLEEAPRMASVRARGQSVVIGISKEQFDRLTESPAAMRTMLLRITRRLRETEAMLRQSERMAQLGTMTAGVAHELNNPAAAVRRAAEQLAAELNQYDRTRVDLGKLGLDERRQQVLVQQLSHAAQRASQLPELDALARSDLEGELEVQLDQLGIGDAWELAPRLADLELDLEALSQDFSPAELQVLLNATASNYAILSLTREIGQAAGRLSEIVKALKTYSFLDQAPVQQVNIHEGLNDTLLILRGKIGQQVNVRREFDPDLPKITAYGSELNQVWTNLIDNALDAVDGAGEVVLRTHHEGDWVVVEVEDNGPGIPDAIQAKIFDPFFTTKPPGKGTGLGLDISYRIVANKHHGDIKVESRPGKTVFAVWLPLDLEDRKVRNSK
jgi:signal transduction histidine kinase